MPGEHLLFFLRVRVRVTVRVKARVTVRGGGMSQPQSLG